MVKSTHIVLFFLLAIVSHEHLSVEARKARKDVKLIDRKDLITTASVAVARQGQLHRGIKEEMNGFVSAFRPTTAGHSPGVGHSIKTSMAGEVASPGQLHRGIKEELDRFVPAFPPPTPLPNPRVGQFIHN